LADNKLTEVENNIKKKHKSSVDDILKSLNFVRDNVYKRLEKK